jgi:DNA repair protein RecO (recombination protein O)
MIISSRAIVLQNVKYSETSLIAKLFTEQLGVVSYIVNGVRSGKGKHRASLFQPSTLLEIQATQRENKNLQRITEYRRYHTYETLPFDIKKTGVAQFITEVLHRSLRHHEPHGELFRFSIDSYLQIDRSRELNPDFHLIFLLKLSSLLGFQPSGCFTDITPAFDLKEGIFVSRAVANDYSILPPHSRYLSRLKDLPIDSPSPVLSSGKERSKLLDDLLNYFRYHLPDFGKLKSPEVLKILYG